MTVETYNNGYNGNAGISNMILLSLAIHAVLILVILFTIPTTKRHLTFGAIYSVSLVSSEIVLPENRAASLGKDLLPGKDSLHTAILKKEVNLKEATPVKKDETNKLNVEKAISAIKKRDISTPADSGARTAMPAPAANSARYSSSQISSQTNQYYAATYAIVKKNFSIPPALMPKENITTIIEVRILKDGTPDYVNFEKRSGNRYFDDAALKAVKKVRQFPVFPEAMRENSVVIGFRFLSAELR